MGKTEARFDNVFYINSVYDALLDSGALIPIYPESWY